METSRPRQRRCRSTRKTLRRDREPGANGERHPLLLALASAHKHCGEVVPNIAVVYESGRFQLMTSVQDENPIVSDIQMPGVGNGVDGYRHLRNTKTVSPLLPFVFMTGMTPEDAQKLMPQDPKVRLLPKPIDFEKLRAVIKELTGLDRPL